MNISLILVFVAVFLTGISQILLKIGSGKGTENKDFFGPYLNLHTLIGYGLLLLVTFISILALREVPLKDFYAIASLNVAVVLVLSWKILGESVNKQQILAVIFILVGIAVFNL